MPKPINILTLVVISLLATAVGLGQSQNASAKNSETAKAEMSSPPDSHPTANQTAHPGDARNCYKMALRYFRAGLFEQAEKALKLALELKPNYPEAHYELGNLYSDRGRWREAI